MVATVVLQVIVDGLPYVAKEHMTYKAMLLSDVPNFAFVLGYTNASWTLKASRAKRGDACTRVSVWLPVSGSACWMPSSSF